MKLKSARSRSVLIDTIQPLQIAVDGGYEKDIHLEEKIFQPLRSYEQFKSLERDVGQKLSAEQKEPK